MNEQISSNGSLFACRGDMSYVYRYGQCDIPYEGNQDREVAFQP